MNALTSNIIADIEIIDLIRNLILATFFAFILGFAVKKFSRIVGDRSQYTIIFPILIPTMVLIISVIKSSLALSLGLVGALSIVRFRTPIKDPEELTYLFVAISVGLGLGAGQLVPTSICFVFLLAILVTVGFFRESSVPRGVFIDIHAPAVPGKSRLKDFSSIIKNNKIPFDLRRFDEEDHGISVTFYIEPGTIDALETLLESFKNDDKENKVTVINRAQSLG